MEHSQDVKCVAWHPTEEVLASGSYDDTIKLYVDDPEDDWFCCATLTGHKSTVWALAWSPSGQYLASGSDDKTVRVWKRTGQFEFKQVLVLEGHERSVYSVSWGKGMEAGAGAGAGWLASAGGDGVIRIWEIDEKSGDGLLEHRMIAKLECAHDVYDLNAIVWCPRAGFEDMLATAGDDGVCKVTLTLMSCPNLQAVAVLCNI
ncbi:WD40-repeat-containing domain protein [Desarmillaria tabescens]|uniref:WD40-repeat-containing domain protein n=1 Tax=Armillaria tabescens TaxID=1929756 RepID=A0AA39MTY1_ARMTA|nr:WD40-repeat-containing domain protein [Desarmillaria tabescens]KAK0446507.1 WD40-repeat-containing domain protein [Desarmillaria tabescens]